MEDAKDTSAPAPTPKFIASKCVGVYLEGLKLGSTEILDAVQNGTIADGDCSKDNAS